MIEKNPILIEYQRRRNAGTIDPITCNLCRERDDTVMPMLLRYDRKTAKYYFQCWTKEHITWPGAEFMSRLEKEMSNGNKVSGGSD